MVHIQKKADSLFLRQTCRMLNRRKSGYRHISYWLGYSMERKLTLHDGPRTCNQPPYLYTHMERLLEKGMEDRTELELLSMTAKGMYTRACLDLQMTRLERRNQGKDLSTVWARITNQVLSIRAKHALFVLVNGLVRNREYMYERWGIGNYMCDFAPDLEERCAGVPQSVEHMFQQCSRVVDAWDWLSGYIARILVPNTLGEEECLSLMYEKLAIREQEDTVIWLLGTYYDYIMREVLGKGRTVNGEELQGYMKQCHATYKQKKMRHLMLADW